jgi:hypothetical protein
VNLLNRKCVTPDVAARKVGHSTPHWHSNIANKNHSRSLLGIDWVSKETPLTVYRMFTIPLDLDVLQCQKLRERESRNTVNKRTSAICNLQRMRSQLRIQPSAKAVRAQDNAHFRSRHCSTRLLEWRHVSCLAPPLLLLLLLRLRAGVVTVQRVWCLCQWKWRYGKLKHQRLFCNSQPINND